MSHCGLWALVATALLVTACEETRYLQDETPYTDTASSDTSQPPTKRITDTTRVSSDTTRTDPPIRRADVTPPPVLDSVYGHVSPPSTPPPVYLQPDYWVTHATQDLMPFWMQEAALGSPVGNFPTYRSMLGAVTNQTERRPRMIGRQIFTYCAAYMLTGETAYLAPAKAGINWLLTHAWDTTTGGWHTTLNAQGIPTGTEPRTAQDAAYVGLGLAAWFYITRDSAAEQRLLDTRDALLDGVFWDPLTGRIHDAVSMDHTTPIDLENDGGSELVAHLDAINAFLLLSQPVLTSEQRRLQFAQDLERMADILIRDFFSQGIFWGVHNQHGNYAGKHVDFGHNLKAFWMLLQLDKRLNEHPLHAFIDTHAASQLSRAYDDMRGRWTKRPTSPTTTEPGADWWTWAECDQLAATLNLQGGLYDDWLGTTAQHWTDFVDTTRPARELIPTIDGDGHWVYPWPDSDTAKANQWKNGYHGLEHALIMYLHGHWRADTTAALHFAPMTPPDTFTAPPYFWNSTESERIVGANIEVLGAKHTQVTIQYSGLF